jgi:hypothetical protein
MLKIAVVGGIHQTHFTPDDLADDAYVLVAATLPLLQPVADAVSEQGLLALNLPARYPLDNHGHWINRGTCQSVGKVLQSRRLSGVWCRSACTKDGRGRELAWFSGVQKAKAVWDTPLQFGVWRHANTWHEIALADQSNPSSP